MITLELVTLTGIKLREEVHEVLLPTPQGQIAVYTNHAPLVSLAETGVISVRKKEGDSDDKLVHYAIDSGLIEVTENGIRVLVDEADKDSDISEKEVEAALAQAKKLKSEARDQVSLDKAQALIDRQATRLKVAELRRRSRR